MRRAPFIVLLSTVALLAGGFAAAQPAASATPSWKVTAGPNPAGSAQTILFGVSCPAANNCFAVGDYFVSSVKQAALLEHWNGTTWKIVPAPKIAGSSGETMTAVSCPTASSCFAVGNTANGSGSKALAEHWNGTTWKVMPNGPAAVGTFLNGVSCAAASNCEAVGAFISTTTQPFIEHWNGTTWKSIASPVEAGAIATSLNGVSCPAANSCFAVGDSFSTGSTTLAEHWNGSTWRITPSPNPAGATTPTLTGVSCAAANKCIAVGDYYIGSSVEKSVIEIWNGTGWKITANPNPATSTATILNGVSCPAANSCYAVGGTYVGGSRSLVEHWNGSTWTVMTIPKPTGSSETGLLAVSCPVTNKCFTAGAYKVGSSGFRPLFARYA